MAGEGEGGVEPIITAKTRIPQVPRIPKKDKREGKSGDFHGPVWMISVRIAGKDRNSRFHTVYHGCVIM